MKNTSPPMRPMRAAAGRLGNGRAWLNGEFFSPAGPSRRSLPHRTCPDASNAIVWPARTSMPVSFQSVVADTLDLALAHAARAAAAVAGL